MQKQLQPAKKDDWDGCVCVVISCPTAFVPIVCKCQLCCGLVVQEEKECGTQSV